MAYVTPQLRVFEQFTTTSTVDDTTRRACIMGPNVQTHRFNNATEKVGLDIGLYDAISGLTSVYPNKTAGSLPALDSIKVWCDHALLRYYADAVGSADTIVADAVLTNRIRAAATNYISKPGYAASTSLGDRGVKVGDVVHVTGTVAAVSYSLWSVVNSFIQDIVPSTLVSSNPSATNQSSVVASATVAGPSNNCVVATIDGTAYTGLATVDVVETYTVTVVTGGSPAAARLRVTSASGRDTMASLVTPSAMGVPTAIGTRGLTLTFDNPSNPACTAAAALAGISATDFVVGQVFTASVAQTFDASQVNVINPAGYLGAVDDTYIITVTKGGLFAANPEISIRTAKGLDQSFTPVVVSGANAAVNIGSFGLQISLSKLVLAGSEIVGLRKGDAFYVSVTAPAGGPARTIVLRDNLPAGLVPATDLNVDIYIDKTIEITQAQLSNLPSQNWTASIGNVTLNPGITTYLPEWTVGGVVQPLSVSSGLVGPYGIQYGRVYVEYNEILVGGTTELGFLFNTADLATIPGPIEPVNPLKFAALKALENAGGAGVGYIAVADPKSVASWQTALDVVSGRSEVYTYVPLTHDTAVHSLVLAQAVSESGPEATNWKRVMVNLPYATSSQLVAVDASNVTVIAVVTNNTLPGPTGNTLVTVQSGNSQFLQKGVRTGDTLRVSYSLDSLGNPVYQTYIVDRVVSDSQLILTSGPSVASPIAEKIEVWRTFTRTEVAQDLVAKAGSLGSYRAMFVQPDMVTAGGYQVPGYFLCAGIAGLMSSVLPHQGLTHFPISGFSGVKARTVDFFNKTQMDTMAEGGVWLVVQDESGSVFSRHAVTTDTSGILIKREEVMTRNLDSLAYDFRNMFKDFIGVTNATPTVLNRMRYLVDKKLESDSSLVINNNLGPRILSGSIATDSAGNLLLRIHPLAADRIELVLNLSLPGPNNVTDLYLVV